MGARKRMESKMVDKTTGRVSYIAVITPISSWATFPKRARRAGGMESSVERRNRLDRCWCSQRLRSGTLEA